MKEEYYYYLLRMILLIVSLMMILFILFSDFTGIIYRVPDDASYYLKIAENFVSGRGFSFDGMHATNGFQPLWQYILIAITYTFRSDPQTTLRIVLIVQIILLYISGRLIFNLLSKYFSGKIVLTCGIVFILFVYMQSVNAMETALLVFMFSFIFNFAERTKIFRIENTGIGFLFGILTGLLMLTRLDSVFFVIPAGSVCIIKIFSGRRLKQNLIMLISIISGASLILLPYLIYNEIQFGSIVPISGYLKSGLPLINLNDKFAGLLGYREIYFAFSSIVYLVWFFIRYELYKNNFFLCMLAVFSAGVILLLVYILYFMNWVIFPWYFITFSLFVSLSISLPLKYLLSYKNLRFANFLYVLITVFISIYWGSKIIKFYVSDHKDIGSNWNIESYKAAQWAKNNTSRNDIFAMKDAGHFSYFSEREVINLDGLVNNFEYQNVLKAKDLNSYLRQNNVKYIVQHALWDRPDITSGMYDTLSLKYISHQYSLESDPVVLKKTNEAYRSDPYFDGSYESVFLIWRYQQK